MKDQKRYHGSDPRPLPSAERLHELFVVDGSDLRWCVSRNSRVRAGDVAGWVRPDGYRRVRIDGVKYRAHRIVWKMVKGEEPPKYIDHVDGNKLNNAPDNLREATNGQNMVNVQENMRTNKSGFRGVSWYKSGGKWQAQIYVDGRKYPLGYFTDPVDAALIYDRAALSVAAWAGYVTTNADLGLIPAGRRLSPEQIVALDARLDKHGLEPEPGGPQATPEEDDLMLDDDFDLLGLGLGLNTSPEKLDGIAHLLYPSRASS